MKSTHPENLPASVPRPGEIIAGKYRVERLLGAGGMGVVVAASHLSLGQPFAVKLMLPELATSPEFSARFLREARAAAAIHGEHAVRIFDVATAEDGTLYMVMELLDGQDLGQLIKERPALPIEEAVGYILQACDALADAHSQGIVHRDLKPGNLFLARRSKGSPILKVLDFGISKSTTLDGAQTVPTLTAPDSVLGTPYYMSPEQLRNTKSVDARTDIWSLGLILHKLITGFSAFESDSVSEHISMIAADPPAPLRLRRPDAPAALEAIVLRCLEKDASRRFEDIGHLVTALAPFAAARSQLEPLSELLSPAAVPQPAPSSPGPGETAPDTITQPAGAPEMHTATTVTSSIDGSAAATQPPGRLRRAGALIAAVLVLAGALFLLRGAKGGVAPASVAAAPLSSPPSSPATPLPTAQIEPTMPVAAAPTPPDNSGPAPRAPSELPPAARAASVPVIKAGAPPARPNPPSRKVAPGAKPTPRPSLMTFQPSDL